MRDGSNNNLSEIGVFSFFIAVASIIATVVNGMLKDSTIQSEYAFIAVFSLFMAMSFALAYAHSRNENNGMNRIAGAFLDAFLALSVSIVIARYLFDNLFISKLPCVIALFSVAFCLFIFSIYMSEGLKPKLPPKLNLTPRTWEYSAVGISIAVFFVVGLVKSGIFGSKTPIFNVHVSVLTVILWVIVLLISVILSLKVSKCCGLLVFMIVVAGYFTFKSPSEVFLIPGFLLMFFVKLFLDNVLFASSAKDLEDTKAKTRDKVEDMKKTRHTKRNKSALSFIWKRLNMRPAKRTLKKRRTKR